MEYATSSGSKGATGSTNEVLCSSAYSALVAATGWMTGSRL